MPSAIRYLVGFLTLSVFVSDTQGQDRAERTEQRITLLDSSPIKISGHFEAPSSPMTLELATRFVGELIDRQRAAGAVEAPLDQLWRSSFLKFIPISPGGHPEAIISSTVQGDDPFFTPAYLTVTGKQLDYQITLSEKRAKILLGP